MPDGHILFGLIEKTDDLFLGTSALIHFRHSHFSDGLLSNFDW